MKVLQVIALVLFSSTFGVEAFGAIDAIPKAYKVDRYEPIWKNSPFTLSTLQDEVRNGIAEQYRLEGYAGMDVVLVDKQTNERYYVNQNQARTAAEKEAPGNLRLVSLQPSADLTHATATIKRGEETATLKFESLAPLATGAPMIPGMMLPPGMPGQIAPPNVGTRRTRRRITTPQVNQSPQTPAPPPR